MVCSEVGYEVWPMALLAVGLFYCFVIDTRRFQRWLLGHRGGNVGLQVIPRWCFGVRVLRAVGIIPTLMMMVVAAALYCFFHGADPSLVRE